MYVSNLEWVDFVTWFGRNNVVIQRAYFNTEWWYQTALPRLDFVYKRSFLKSSPEELSEVSSYIAMGFETKQEVTKVFTESSCCDQVSDYKFLMLYAIKVDIYIFHFQFV